MFLTGISTRSLSLIYRRPLGRKLSHTEISEANKELSDSIEQVHEVKWSHSEELVLDVFHQIETYFFDLIQMYN